MKKKTLYLGILAASAIAAKAIFDKVKLEKQVKALQAANPNLF